jgi:P27 family predicted phage terminase small subunit
MGKLRAPAAPGTLGAEGLRLWRTLTARYGWSREQLSLVTILCETRDRIEEARAAIAADGAYLRSEGGMRVWAHPALKGEKDAKTSFVSAWKALGLDLIASSTGGM